VLLLPARQQGAFSRGSSSQLLSASAVPHAVKCIRLLLQGGAEKLSDEAIEGTLEKVIKLLAYISDKVPGCSAHTWKIRV
jgi:hypothetical protein